MLGGCGLSFQGNLSHQHMDYFLHQGFAGPKTISYKHAEKALMLSQYHGFCGGVFSSQGVDLSVVLEKRGPVCPEVTAPAQVGWDP